MICLIGGYRKPTRLSFVPCRNSSSTNSSDSTKQMSQLIPPSRVSLLLIYTSSAWGKMRHQQVRTSGRPPGSRSTSPTSSGIWTRELMQHGRRANQGSEKAIQLNSEDNLTLVRSQQVETGQQMRTWLTACVQGNPLSCNICL